MFVVVACCVLSRFGVVGCLLMVVCWPLLPVMRRCLLWFVIRCLWLVAVVCGFVVLCVIRCLLVVACRLRGV